MKNLEILRLVVGQLATNCYIIKDRETNEAVILDPGEDSEYIKSFIQERQITPKYIIATHGHFDHILAAADLQIDFKIPFMINEKDKFLVNSMDKRAKKWLKRKIFEKPPMISSFLRNKEELKLGKDILKVIYTPGHTPGSISLYSKKEKMIFSGDTLFAEGYMGRTDFSYSDPKLIKKSIAKIINLSGKTRIFPGHGENTNVEKEKKVWLLNFFRSNITL